MVNILVNKNVDKIKNKIQNIESICKENKFMLCEACGSPLQICQAKCSKGKCAKVYNKAFFGNPLAYLEEDEIELMIALLANDGALGATAQAIKTSKYHLLQKMNLLKGKLNELGPRIETLREFLTQNK